MRPQLLNKVGTRKTFTATFERYGSVGESTTALLHDIKCSGTLSADHVWVIIPGDTPPFECGDRIRFSATVKMYNRGGLIWESGLTDVGEVEKI